MSEKGGSSAYGTCPRASRFHRSTRGHHPAQTCRRIRTAMTAHVALALGLEAQNYTRRWLKCGEIAAATLRDGTRIRYVRVGKGPNLVLTHTVRTQLDLFQRVIPLLSPHFTVYALDLPGFGWSDL